MAEDKQKNLPVTLISEQPQISGQDRQAWLIEYQTAQTAFNHYDSFRWQSGALLITGSLVLWGLLFSKSSDNFWATLITTIFVTALLSVWILFAHHYRQLYMTKAHRMHEIEKLLGMQTHLRLGFLGKRLDNCGKYEIHGKRGHQLDNWMAGIVLLFGPVLFTVSNWASYQSGYDVLFLFILLLIPMVAYFLVTCIAEKQENAMIETFKKVDDILHYYK